jgi:hypothetical protein
MEELYEGKLEFHRPTAEELEQERVQAEADAAALVMAEGELPSLDALLSEVTEH